MSEKVKVTVADNPGENRYEARTESGVVAGFAAYERSADLITFTHTEVDDAFAGQGVASTLVRGALDHVRTTGLAVAPLCPFVKGYIDKHPEYADLVTGG